MWRGIVFVVVAAACDQGHKRSTYTLLVDTPVTVATDAHAHADSLDDDDIPAPEDTIAHLTVPALAVNPRGLLVAWEMQRRMEGEQGRIVARRLSHDLKPVGNSIEVGNGIHPSATARSDGYAVAWIDNWADDSITLTHIAGDGSISRPIVARGAPACGTASLAVGDDAVTAVACSCDDKKLVVALEAHRKPVVEQRPMQGGCNEPVVGGHGRPIVLIHPTELGRTDIIELGSTSSKSVASPAAYCIDVLNVSDAPTLLCLDKAFGTAFSFIRTRAGGAAFADRVPINVRPAPEVVEAHAVAVDQGILLAWTTHLHDETQLNAALVGKDGSLLAPEVRLSPAPRLPRFDLVGLGSSAWLTFVTEQPPVGERYNHNVIVARLRIIDR